MSSWEGSAGGCVESTDGPKDMAPTVAPYLWGLSSDRPYKMAPTRTPYIVRFVNRRSVQNGSNGGAMMQDLYSSTDRGWAHTGYAISPIVSNHSRAMLDEVWMQHGLILTSMSTYDIPTHWNTSRRALILACRPVLWDRVREHGGVYSAHLLQ